MLSNFSFTAVGKHEFGVLAGLIFWVDIYFLLTLLHGARHVWKYYNIYYATLRLPLLPLEWWRMYGKLWMTFLATTDKNRTVVSDRTSLFKKQKSALVRFLSVVARKVIHNFPYILHHSSGSNGSLNVA